MSAILLRRLVQWNLTSSFPRSGRETGTGIKTCMGAIFQHRCRHTKSVPHPTKGEAKERQASESEAKGGYQRKNNPPGFKRHWGNFDKENFLKLKAEKRQAFDNILVRLRAYKEVHGDMLVPYGFTIPRDTAEWPEETWGFKLGNTVNKIRNRGYYKEHHHELKVMGLSFDTLKRDFSSVRRGLLKYKDLHGDMLVPMDFVIPADSSEWPESVWGLKLGVTVFKIRNTGIFKANFDELKEMGFDYESPIPALEA